MNFQFAQPSDLLKPYIKQYWALENTLRNGECCIQRIIPGGLPELILYLDHKPSVTGNKRSIEDRFLLNGQQNDYYDLQITESLSVFSIMFQPQGISRFFALPISELFNQSVPLKYLNKALAEDLEVRLSNAFTFRQKVQILEACLLKLLNENHGNYEFRRITGTIERIKNAKGNIGIEQLASEACLSRKQFERIFTRDIGISPKQYLKIIRMQACIFFKSKNKNETLTSLAYESGYYDQSHFIADFKLMTGHTPGQFFNACDSPQSDFFE